MNEYTLLDSLPRLSIKGKKIRLIELFAGIGSQALALERLQRDTQAFTFEQYRICEFDAKAVASYNAIHGTDFVTSDITKLQPQDLGIVDVDKYTYIMTYSFPCQDISMAGKQQGFTKGSGTRSGLLWEVERLLRGLDTKPQILLMENVSAIANKGNIECFRMWIDTLKELGYESVYKIMNAKDYGIPQSRGRCFMVSWLDKTKTYQFPGEHPGGAKYKVSDYLEDTVSEDLYLHCNIEVQDNGELLVWG